MNRLIGRLLRSVGTLSISIATVFLFLTLSPSKAFAYEEDTHFLLTYVICRSAGMSDKDALIVASMNQGMDDSKAVAAVDKVMPQIKEQWMWHAIAKDSKSVAGVLKRRDLLFEEAVKDTDARNRLIRLGLFFHFQQDSWAHRIHGKANSHSRDAYSPVSTPDGHARWANQPDRPPFDPVAAFLCLEEGIAYATQFVSRTSKTKPNPFFANYKSMGGLVDKNWKDPRKGSFFNQLDITGMKDGSARLFLASLIRAQIETYTASKKNPPYLRFNTANRGDLEKIASALEEICDRFKASVGTIRLPSQTQKTEQGFQKMTTSMIISLTPGDL